MRVRKFAKIYPYIWKSEKLRKASKEGKLLALYLLSNPYYCMVGIYELPMEFVKKDTGLSAQEAKKAMDELRELDFLRYDEVTEVVWVVDMAMSQVADRRLNEKQQTGVMNELSRLHLECDFPFVDEFISRYKSEYKFLPDNADELCYY